MRTYQHALLTIIVALGLQAIARAADDAPQVDPTGTWKWERTFGENKMQYTLRLQRAGDKLTGTIAVVRNGNEPAGREPTKIDAGKVEGNKISFKVTREFNGNEFTIDYHGSLEGDTIKGQTEANFGGNQRQFDWLATRSLELADLLGTWELKIQIPNSDPAVSTLKISRDGEQFKGSYTSQFFGENEAKDLAVRDGQLSYTVTLERDGNSFTAKYTAKPRGDSITGTIQSEINGETSEINFEGQRKSEPESSGS